ncbi:hypothetical protein F5Y08DRAFT_199183 [Xylaria arbuscula]|nr:hypothetical protein F5Y08DRAFT_199183 [Xylaria arbuscula]
MAITFPSFSNLPAELRIQIWTLTASPRILHICAASHKHGTFSYASPTPAPAVMQVCRESRQVVPYKKSFFTAARYIWVNFQQDMICLADHRLEWLEPYQAEIGRLRFTVPIDDHMSSYTFYSYWFHNNSEILKPFSALRELHIAVQDSICFWGSTVEGTDCSLCTRYGIRFLDLHTGLLLTGPQIGMAYSWNWQKGGLIRNVDDVDEDIRFDRDNYTGICLDELAEID